MAQQVVSGKPSKATDYFFSHASEMTVGKLPGRKFALTGYRTCNLQVTSLEEVFLNKHVLIM